MNQVAALTQSSGADCEVTPSQVREMKGCTDQARWPGTEHGYAEWRCPCSQSAGAPLECGLLGGVGRAQALESGRLQEAVVRREDLARATQIAFVNSLRGWLAADALLPMDAGLRQEVKPS